MTNYSVEQKLQRAAQKLAKDRINADQGEFFFARLIDSMGRIIPHPVFVVGKKGDSNDDEDIIVCQCTSQPARNNDYDIPVQLLKESFVRTNKLFLVGRDQLQFKIQHNNDSDTIKKVIDAAVKAINHKT